MNMKPVSRRGVLSTAGVVAGAAAFLSFSQGAAAAARTTILRWDGCYSGDGPEKPLAPGPPGKDYQGVEIPQRPWTAD